MNLTGAKSLLKKIKGLYSKTPISQGCVYLERICSLQGTEVWKHSELQRSCCRGTASIWG